MAVAGASLGKAWVEVTADATGIAGSLKGDVERAAKAVVAGFDDAFARVEGDAEDAARKVGDSLGDGAKDAAKAVSDSLADGAEDGTKRMSAAVDSGGGGFVDKIKAVAGLAAAAFGAAFVIDSFLQTDTAVANLQASLGASPEFAAQMGQVAGDLYADNFGDSVGDAAAAVKATLQKGLLPEDATNAQIESVTGNLMTLAGVMEVDVGEAARAAGSLVKSGLAGTAAEAVDILARGVQQGANSAGDLADVLGEYGSTFAQLGLDGAQSVGLMNQALAANIPNADFAADALREMGIKGREGGDAAAEALDSLGLSSKTYFANMREGGPAAAHSLGAVLESLRNTEDPAKRAAAATALIGTQYEDLGDAILSLDPGTAVADMGQIEGAAQGMSDVVGDTAAGRIETFKRGLQTLATDALGALVGGFTDGKSSGEGFTGAMSDLGTAIRDVTDWLREHKDVLGDIIDVVRTVMIPVLAAWGAAATLSAGKNVAAWLSVAFESAGSAAAQEKSAAQVALSWLAMGVKATIQGVKIAAVWTAQIVADAAKGAADFAVQAGKVVASWALMAARAGIEAGKIAAVWTAQIVGDAIKGAASFAIQAGKVVAGWALMAGQALLQAGRMAAAWFIALGPIGWVIAAVLAVVALVVSNWDTIKEWTVAAWHAVVAAVAGAWEWIKEKVSAAFAFLLDLFLHWTPLGIIINHWEDIKNAFLGGVNAVVGFVSQLPGRILSGIGNFGGLLVDKGRQLMQGLVDGIASAASFVGNVARNIVNAVIRFVNDRLIGGINNLLEFTIAGVHIDVPDIPRIPLLAAGAVVNRPTLAIVGEAGPEVVLPLSPGRAGRRQQLMGEAGIGGGGVQVTYSPQLTVPSAPTAAEAAAILEQDLDRSLSLGLLNARLGEVTAA